MEPRLIILVLLVLSACGKETSCRLLPGKESTYFDGKCPSGQVLVGVQGNSITCAEATILCPQGGAQ